MPNEPKPIPTKYHFLLLLSRPRQVRRRDFLSTLYFLVIFVLVLFTGLLSWACHSDPVMVLWARWCLIFIIVPIVLVVTLVWSYMQGQHHLWLVSNGEIAFGRVTARRMEGMLMPGSEAGYQSVINYEFHDAAGHCLEGKGKDLTSTFSEKMVIPVFYDPVNSSDHTVLTDLSEIVVPDRLD